MIDIVTFEVKVREKEQMEVSGLLAQKPISHARGRCYSSSLQYNVVTDPYN